MKIGILTYWWSNDNYGQLLQCYALQAFLKKNGHNPYFIKYRVQKKKFIHYLQKALNLHFFFYWLINRSKVQKEQKSHCRHFEEFRKKYIKMSELQYSSIDELRKFPPEADAYVVGSDQVWNTYQNKLKTIKPRIHAYFLDFGNEKVKRLSYSASWGINELGDDFIKEISPLLKKFDYVSVREPSGVKLCQKCGRNDAEWVCDPTLLLSANSYRQIYKSEEINVPSGKFILLYLLKNQCEINIESVYKFGKERGLKVLYVTGNGRIDDYEKVYPSIPEWLYLVDNAEYVITNSFHCSVFSILFNKRFCVSKLTGNCIQMNDRFNSLFSMVGTGSRFINNDDFSILDVLYTNNKVTLPENFLRILEGNSHYE